ncbi:MAG: hypothetical protein ACI9H6_000646 [Patiriisocius sp.]|jgi:hypothetical protein
MSKKIEIYRFAFGTPEMPGSNVWRVNVRKDSGDIYINNAPQFGRDIHISLHASGNFSIKLNEDRKKIESPCVVDETQLLNGPCIFFDTPERNIPPAIPTGSVNKIIWLGWPKEDHLMLIRTYYCKPVMAVRAEVGEQLICGPVEAKLFHEDMHFYMIAEHREKTPEEKLGKVHHENMDFGKHLPSHMELIRVTKTPQGPTAILIENFTAKITD